MILGSLLTPNMAPYLHRHHPLIAARIEFLVEPLPLIPSIKSRIEFTPERLVYSDKSQTLHEATDDGANAQTEPAVAQVDNVEPSRPTLVRQTPTFKIPKPSGEPGRPLSGGYGLSSTLVNVHNWSEKSVEELTVSFRLSTVVHKFNVSLCRQPSVLKPGDG